MALLQCLAQLGSHSSALNVGLAATRKGALHSQAAVLSPSVIGLLVSQVLLFLLGRDAPWLFSVVSNHCKAREAHFSVGSVSSRSISSCFMNAALPPATTSLSPSSAWSGEERAWVLPRF